VGFSRRRTDRHSNCSAICPRLRRKIRRQGPARSQAQIGASGTRLAENWLWCDERCAAQASDHRCCAAPLARCSPGSSDSRCCDILRSHVRSRRWPRSPGGNIRFRVLAQCAALSRSTFVRRFTDLVGRPPMTVLRDLRMRQAAHQLASGTLTLDQIAGHTGYESRSSFVRAFRKGMAVPRLSIGTGFLNDRIAFASRAESRNPRRVAAPEFSAPSLRHERQAGLSIPSRRLICAVLDGRTPATDSKTQGRA
jgi:AraC-like DNA-binding protein